MAVFYDCTKIYLYKYDGRTTTGNITGNFGLCGQAAFVNQANLIPGAVHTLNITAYTPNGLPSGNLNQSVMTIFAQAGL